MGQRASGGRVCLPEGGKAPELPPPRPPPPPWEETGPGRRGGGERQGETDTAERRGTGKGKGGEHEGGAEDTSCGRRGLSTLICAMGLWVPARPFKLRDHCSKLRKCRRAGGEEEGSRRGGREGEGGARLERRRQCAAGPTGSGSKFSLWSLRVSVRAGPGGFQRTRS